MKITLIYPAIGQYLDEACMEPLSLGALAGFTPPDVEVALYDDRLEPIPYDEPTNLVAITVQIYAARRSYEISAEFRKRGVPVILGGVHPTLLPEEAAQPADSIFMSDAENRWHEVIEDARQGRLKPVYHGAATMPQPDSLTRRDLYKGKKYLPISLLQFGRGCRFACDFCSIHAFYGRSMPRRRLEDVLSELDELRGQYVFFADDNLFTDKEQAAALFKALKPFNIHWACQISLDIVQSPRLLDLMGESGCVGALIGFESLNEANLIQMKKKWNSKQGDYADALAQIYARGIMVFGSFVFGYDHDTTDSFDRTFEFAMKSKMALAHFNPLFPTPGTSLYARLKSQGRLPYERWWLDDNYRYGYSLFQPKNMTPDELRDGILHLRREFNTYGAIAHRMFEPRSNARTLYHLFVYLMVNLITKKEIRNKQGELLGDGSPLPALEKEPE